MTPLYGDRLNGEILSTFQQLHLPVLHKRKQQRYQQLNTLISDVVKQQTVVSPTTYNSDIITHGDGSSSLLNIDKQLNVTTLKPTSTISTAQNIYRSRENLTSIGDDEIENIEDNMENGFSNTQPSDEELKDFLEFIEKGQAHDDNIEFEQDQMRKRTAAELGKITFYRYRKYNC